METPRFEYHVTQNSGEAYCYRLYRPDKRICSRRYPLIVFLHGGGGRGMDNESQMENREPDLWADLVESRSIEPCFIAAPQQPPQYGFFMESDCVGTVLREIILQHPVDMNRIYLTGVSMGGMGCWSEAAKYPNLFAAFLSAAGVYPDSRYTFPVGGVAPAFPEDVVQIPVPPEESSGAMKRYAKVLWDLPIRHIHSAADKMAPVHYAREMANYMEEAGATQFIYVEYPQKCAISHTETYQAMMRDPVHREWLLEQRRGKK